MGYVSQDLTRCSDDKTMTNQLTVVPPEASTGVESPAPATNQIGATDDGIELARSTHANFQDMVKVADAKATTLVALHTLILGGGLAVLDKLQPWLAGFFFLASMASLVCAAWVIKPRFPDFPVPNGCRGLLWINGLPAMTDAFDSYVTALAATSRHQLILDLAFENTKIAHLLATKFRWLSRAIHALFTALALFMLLLGWNLLNRGTN